MNNLLLIVLFLIIWVLSAIAHERDIYNACANTGESSYAMWTASITCKPKELEDE